MMLVQAAADVRLHADPSHASTASVSVVIPALN
jgi:hypothetical protein